MKASKQTGRPVLALFTGSDWCVPCKRLEAEIFDTPVFQSWAKQHVVLLKLDYPQHHPQPADVKAANMHLAQRYNVSAFPTIVIVSSSGHVLTKQAGYNPVGPSFWTKSTEAVLSNRSRG